MTGTKPRDLARELHEWDGNWPECWRPQEGEVLVGTIRMYSTGQSQYGPVRTAIIERDEGSRVSVWLSSTVLLSLFERERPKLGERIGLRYLGKHPEKAYKRFALVVDRPEAEPDFSPLGGESPGEPEPLGTTGDTLSVTSGRSTDRAAAPGYRTTKSPTTPYADRMIRSPGRPAVGRQPAPVRGGTPPHGVDDDPFVDI